jgi:lipopolysaccharide transport system ATP-binding protein
VIRYEDLIKDQLGEIQKIAAFCRLDISEDKLQAIVANNSFEKKTGRNPGEEDIFSHQRKGLAGDWRHYFDERVAGKFIRKFGHILIETGYEKDYHWAD